MAQSTTTTDLVDGVCTIDDPRRVIVIEHRVEYPLTDLWADVFVVGPESKQIYPLLARAKCRKADTIDQADIVFFSGSSSDVDPILYGQVNHNTVHTNSSVDVELINAFMECAYLGVPMVGICGGAQFLHVANSGKLFQHIDKHQAPHDMFVKKGGYYMNRVSSVHHQCCMPNPENGMEVLAEAYLSTQKWEDTKTCRTGLFDGHDFEVEAFWYPETACFGVQGHPEYQGFEEYTSWFTEQIEGLILHNPDIELVGEGKAKMQRLKKEVMDNRSWRVPATFYKFLENQRKGS